MSQQQPPRSGESGNQPPGNVLPRLRPQPTRTQRRLLWGMLAVSLVGFAVYFLAIVGGPDTAIVGRPDTPAPAQPCGEPLFDSPVQAAVGITGITLTVAAVVTTWVVYLRVTSKLATVILAITIVLCAMATFTPRVC